MYRFHVVVFGAHPDKILVDGKSRYTEFPTENIDFIVDMLKRFEKSSVAALYHNNGKGTDEVVEEYAYNYLVRDKQFPVYWKFAHSAALFQAQEMAIDTALNHAFAGNRDSTPDVTHQTIVIIFHNGPADDLPVHLQKAKEYATRKNVDAIRLLRLPVNSKEVTEHAATSHLPF